LETGEGESLVSKGKAIRISRRCYRMMPPPVTPSKAQDSACSLTVSDMNSLADWGKMAMREHERLTGWGFFAYAK